MKSITAGVKVGVLFLLMVGGAYGIWKNLGTNPAGDDSFPLYARFRDASGLHLGGKVVVAGLPVGQISELSVDGRFAKVTFRVRRDVEVWSSAVVVKKATSLLGENYLEIDPGGAEAALPDGTRQAARRLAAGDQVPRVVEATTPDQLLRRIEETLPEVDAVLVSVKDLSEDVRRIVNGPLASVSTRIDALVQKESGTVSDILARAASSMARIDQITTDIRTITRGADGRVASILDNLDQASAEARGLVTSARSEVEQTGAAVRQKLDSLDGVVRSADSIGKKIDGDQGTLGRLVNDPAIADNVEQITDDAKGFLGSIFNLRTYVGLRSEYNVFAGLARHYVSIELRSRPDKFYLIEIEKGPRGDYPTVTLNFDPTVDPNHWIRRAVIQDKYRFTFQFAKQFGWLTLRYGIKESTGGAGLDAHVPWFGRDAGLSLDVFDATFDRFPRVKLTAAYEVFRSVYILGGVDEALNAPRDLAIATGATAVPTQFETFRYGRDYFFGGMLRFNDEDLAALLAVGGSALAGAAR